MFSSPVAIFLYVVSVIGLIAAVIAHMHKEKYISSILQSSPTRRSRLIQSYKNMIRMQRLLIFVLLISIVTMIISYCVLDKDNFFLLMIGFAVVVIIKMVADMLLRRSVIARVEVNQYATDPQFTAPDYSQEDTSTKVRRVNFRLSIIGISIPAIMLAAFAIVLYFTVGGPAWAYAIVTLFALLVVCVTLKTTIK